MPQIKVNGVSLNYVDEGTGPETILFSHGFLMSHQLFAPQVAHFKDRYRCVAYDHRGQAGSEVPPSGYDMDTIAADAAALIEALDIAPCHIFGLSMGGFVGMRLGARRPELVKSLVLMDTSAEAEPNAFKYRLLGLVARFFGLGAVAGRAMPILFGKTFMSDPARAEDRAMWRSHLVNGHSKDGILRALRGVTDRDGVTEELARITAPTLVLTGDEDVATVPAKGERVAQGIRGATFKVIPRAGHSASVEEPDAVITAIEEHLAAVG